MFRSALLLLTASAALAAPVPKAVKKPPSLNGKWITAERIHEGVAIKDPWVWVIEGESLTAHSWQNGGVGQANYVGATLTLTRPDETKVDEYDYTYSDGTIKLVYRGRLTWDGDEWLFCFGPPGGERPAEVKAGDGVFYHRFKRMPDK